MFGQPDRDGLLALGHLVARAGAQLARLVLGHDLADFYVLGHELFPFWFASKLYPALLLVRVADVSLLFADVRQVQRKQSERRYAEKAGAGSKQCGSAAHLIVSVAQYDRFGPVRAEFFQRKSSALRNTV